MATGTLAPREKSSTFRTITSGNAKILPLPFFFMEELLQARADSVFPTNAAEFDEDVNVYLAHLLASRGLTQTQAPAAFGSAPQWYPPTKSQPPDQRAHWYLAQGEHRLLALGLFERGEDCRRRAQLWGLTSTETRQRDLVCGQSCYQVAANLLARGRHLSARAEIVRKVARYFPRYVQVLATLATGRWDFGAHLSDLDLHHLLGQVQPSPIPVGVDKSPADMDHFLDELSAYRTFPTPMQRCRILGLAKACGVNPQRLDLT